MASSDRNVVTSFPRDLHVEGMTANHNVSKEKPHGLDRASTASVPPQADQAREDEIVITDDESRGPNKLDQISKRIRLKLHRRTRDGSGKNGDQRMPDLKTLELTLAPPPTRVHENDRFSGEPPSEKPSLPPLKEYVTKPVGTVKSIARAQGGNEFAENVANTAVSHGANVNLVLAHEKVAASMNDQDVSTAVEDIETLKKVQQDSLVRWTMDRHVRKVKNLQAERVPWPQRKDFVRNDDGREKWHWLDHGRDVRCIVLYSGPFYQFDTISERLVMHWSKRVLLIDAQVSVFYLKQYGARYIGASSELPEPTQSALISSFERVLLTSIQTQNMVMKLLSVAFWESPTETAAYAVLYFTLCVYNYVTRAFILWAIYTVLKARYYPPTIQDLRKKLERSEDKERRAHDLVELIQQHGAHGWVASLMDKTGPTIQLQLEDLANFMEILQNFHQWRDPYRTAITLAMLSFLWLMVTLTPVWLLVKGSFIGIGVAFFVIVPISHWWSQYRLLVSPMTWLFWNIPNHGEWAISRLQEEATQRLQKARHEGLGVQANNLSVAEEPIVRPTEDHRTTQHTTSRRNRAQSDAMTVGRYHCTDGKLPGTLCLDTEGVHFQLHVTKSEKWKVKYAELKSMQKTGSSAMISSGDDILFVDMRDTEYHVSALKLRDEVFTQVIGYSGVEWQITG